MRVTARPLRNSEIRLRTLVGCNNTAIRFFSFLLTIVYFLLHRDAHGEKHALVIPGNAADLGKKELPNIGLPLLDCARIASS